MPCLPGLTTTLEQAQLAKYERVCQRLQLAPSDHVLEIGGGWGGFAEFAAREFGCRVTTTTISQRQYAWAADRARQAALTDRVTVLQQDYRRLNGRFDKLVSIEMIEAVGHAYFATFFGQCSRLLKPDGLMALQGITIPDQRYEEYLRNVDFIQKYIFPGGCLPSLGAISAALARATDLRLVELKDFSLDYAETLARWSQRFEARRVEILRLIPSEQFFRTWQFYFAYCEAGFREGMIGLAQMLLAKSVATCSFNEVSS